MQLCNVTLRLAGSLLHTVPKTDITPAEILVLQHIHGSDAVVDVRPTRQLKNPRHADIYEKLATDYDRAASASAPGDDSKSILASLFPGAIKRLPTTLKEIGLGHLMSPASIAAAAAADAAVLPSPADVAVPDANNPDYFANLDGDEAEGEDA